MQDGDIEAAVQLSPAKHAETDNRHDSFKQADQVHQVQKSRLAGGQGYGTAGEQDSTGAGHVRSPGSPTASRTAVVPAVAPVVRPVDTLIMVGCCPPCWTC
jgi:hypothetical protein